MRIVDTDVHPAPRSTRELRGYCPEPWRSMDLPERLFGADTAARSSGPPYVAPGGNHRRDSIAPTGGPACSDPDFTAQQLLEDAGVDYAILIPVTVRPLANAVHEAAIAAATNHWLAQTWLSRYQGHERYRGTLRVSCTSPELAAREIEAWAGHPSFVQVMLVPSVDTPFGSPRYDPIYAAAARHNLPLAVHVQRSAGLGLLTPLGFASYFFEHHPMYAQLYATHLLSMLCEGVFERFPTLQVVFVEGGFSWMAPLIWRLDRHWKELRSEVPALKRPPSAYLRDHVRFTSQPIEEPQDTRHLARVLDWMDAERILMFATDYPHWDGDYDPRQVFQGVPEAARQRMLCENARELYGLPPTRPAAS